VNPVTVGQSVDAILTITNTGNSTLTVSGIDVPSDFSADWTSGTIASGASQAVSISFSPTDALDYSGAITVNGDQTSGTNSVSVSGTGLEVTKIIALDNDIEFVNPVTVGQSVDAILTITNTGNSTLTVSGIDVPSGFSADWTSGTIAPGASQVVSITFSPTDTIVYSGTITVNGDQTSGTNSVSVSGSALVTSIHKEVQQDYSVYPNPAKSMITIKGVDGFKKVELIDLLGRLIVIEEFNGNMDYYELNLSDQNLKGLYLLNIYGVKGKISSRKIVFE